MNKEILVSYENFVQCVFFSVYSNFLLFSCFHFRRESWPLFSSYSCYQQLVTQTKTLSKDHAALSEVYSTHLVSRLQQVVEDVQRIYKRVSKLCVLELPQINSD